MGHCVLRFLEEEMDLLLSAVMFVCMLSVAFAVFPPYD